MSQYPLIHPDSQAGHWYGIRVDRPYTSTTTEASRIASRYLNDVGGAVDIVVFRSVNDRGSGRSNSWPTNFSFYIRWPFKIALLDLICLTDQGHDGRLGEVIPLIDMIKSQNVSWSFIPHNLPDTSKLSIEAALEEIHRHPLRAGAPDTPVPL